MRSGTSFFDGTVFKKTVFRFWPLWGVYLTGWLLALPLSGLTMLRMDAQAMPGIDRGYMENFAFYQMPNLTRAMVLPVAVVFGVLTAMAVFSHLFSARSANLFGSLPIRREGLFLTHYLAGLSFLIVPNVVIFLLTLAVEAAGGAVAWMGLLFWLAVSCGEGFFFYTLAVFCAMFTGHILALPAFYAIVNGFVMGIFGLLLVVLQSFYYGFAGFPDWVETVLEWFTPVLRLGESVDYHRYWFHEELTNSILSDDKIGLEVEGLGTVGVYAIAAVVLAVCAFLLYRRRRLESAGDVVAVNAMKPVFRYGVALCTGLAFGMGTMMFIYGGEVALMIAIVVWGIVGYFAAEMLLQKSFRVFKKWKGAVAVTAVFAALFCVVGFDLTGYETRVPDPANVESVNISGLGVMYLQDDGDYFDLDADDPEVIRMVTRLHRAAVDQRDWDWETSAGTNTSLYVTYRLKSGGTLTRSYHTIWIQPAEAEQEGTASWAVQQIYSNRELCWRMYGFDRLEDFLASGGRLTSAEYSFYNNKENWMDAAYYYGSDAETLLAAVKEDFFAGRIGARRVTADKWNDKWYSDQNETLSFSSDNRDNGRHYYITIAMSDTATSTLAALEELAGRADWRSGVGYDKWYGGEYPNEIIMEPVTTATMFVG